MLGYENQLYVGTQYGNVEVYDSESSIFLQQFSLHNGEVCMMLKLPPEVHQCVCPELLSNTDDKYTNRESFTDPNCIKAPLIISLGTGKADWLNVDSTEDFQPHILTWSGCGSINLYS